MTHKIRAHARNPIILCSLFACMVALSVLPTQLKANETEKPKISVEHEDPSFFKGVSDFFTETFQSLKEMISLGDSSEELRFVENTTTGVRVSPETDLNSLEIRDKLKLKSTKLSRAYLETFDARGDFVREITFVSHENHYPEWYNIPLTTTINSTGITNTFSSQNNYLQRTGSEGRDSRSGSSTSSTGYSTTVEADFTKEYKHSTKALVKYQNDNTSIKTNGLLSTKIYTKPSLAVLQQLEASGFQIQTTQGVTTATNSTCVMIWNPNTLTFTIKTKFDEDDDGNDTVNDEDDTANDWDNTCTYYYVKNEVLNENVLVKCISVDYEVFTNGDCYEKYSISLFSDYTM